MTDEPLITIELTAHGNIGKLEPCPVCDKPLTLTRPDGKFYICTFCDQVWIAEHFHTLARRAEIGRIVEENAAKTTAPISITQDERGWHVAWEWTRIQRDSLLDALRALASKLNITDETGGTTR